MPMLKAVCQIRILLLATICFIGLIGLMLLPVALDGPLSVSLNVSSRSLIGSKSCTDGLDGMAVGKKKEDRNGI